MTAFKKGIQISVLLSRTFQLLAKGVTPFRMTRNFKHITPDLKWASMSNESDKFTERLEFIDNVHLQGKYETGFLVPTVGRLDYKHAFKTVNAAGYSGTYTIELEGNANYENMFICVS